MSVPAPVTGSAVELADDDGTIVGLEDYDPATDVITPRLTIQHKAGTFKNNLSNEEFSSLEVIVLGTVKQRALWPPTFDGSDNPPKCKSQDFNLGNPNGDEFPWKESGFNRADYLDEGAQLPCASCALREWGSNPINHSTPWCSEQHTYVILLKDGNGDFTMPALFTASKTGIGPSRKYMSSFQQSKTPMFVTTTKLSLDMLKRGVNEYCVPVFNRGTETDKANYKEWVAMYRKIRAFLQSQRSLADEDDASVPAASPAAGASPAGSPASAPAAGTTKDDEEIPF